ncbi:MAG: hypothetical protein LUH15_03370 [Tannerellaceae bacterium]|nr:hypothetical protein [Tannerellaceae bacterium]
MYDASGTRIADSQTTESGSPYQSVAGIDNNLKNAIMNPFIYYGGIGITTNPAVSVGYHPVADWYCENAYYVQHKGRFERQSHNLWNGKAQGKMPFDPCQKGYRVPRMQDWGVDDSLDENLITPLTGINNGHQISNYGVTNPAYGGNYHKSGWRYLNGQYFANRSSTNGHHNRNDFNFHSRIIRHTGYNPVTEPFDVTQSYGRAHGMSVKCVADDKD